MNAFGEWLSSNGFMPQGFCYQWKPSLIWLHAISDSLIALSYFSLPLALLHFVRKRRDLPFAGVFVCFGIFIAACGATHAMDVWTLWVPSYWFSGSLKVLTALASLPTAILLIRVMPAALSLPSPAEVHAANEALTRQAATLRASEERFRQMAENIQEIFWMMDPRTKEVTYVSPAFEQICELPVDFIYSNPTSYDRLMHPGDRQHVLAALEVLETTQRLDEEFRIVCPGGTIKWVRAIGFIARDSTGESLTFVGTVQEITARKNMEFALRESEDLFRDLVEHSSDLICTHSLDGRLLHVNELPVRLLGYSREELLNKPMRDFLLPEARTQFDESLITIQKEGSVRGLMVVLTKTGERRVWEYHNTLRTDGVNTPIVRGIAHDVTEQKRMERALRLSEEKFSKAFLASPYAIVISSIEDGRLIEVNDSFLRIMGFTREESIGRTSFELGIWVNTGDRDKIFAEIQRTDRVRSIQMQFQTKHGVRLEVNYSAEIMELGGSKCLLSVCEDISERIRSEEKLRQAQARIERLSGQLLRLQDEERRRIARDLHDSLGQDLAGLAMTLGQLRVSIPSVERKAHRLLSESKAIASRCVREVRTMSYLLHPPALEHAGLAEAIREYIKGFNHRSGIDVQLELSPRIGRLEPDTELALFRVVQESLTNIQRHSGSPRAKIRIHRDTDLNLEISDAGRGVSSVSQKRSDLAMGVGIPSMEERVKLVGGKFHIDSTMQGTTVQVTIPVDRLPASKTAQSVG